MGYYVTGVAQYKENALLCQTGDDGQRTPESAGLEHIDKCAKMHPNISRNIPVARLGKRKISDV